MEYDELCTRLEDLSVLAGMNDERNSRTEGRSENADTLEEQLQSGLEDSFPASDPPAVVSTSISGGSKDIVGTDEVLRRKKEAAQRKQEKADAS